MMDGLSRLPLPLRPIELELRLQVLVGARVAVTIAPGAVWPVAVLPGAGVLRVRLSPAFLYAPPPVVEALARHARSPLDLAADELLDAFAFGVPEPRLAPAPPGTPRPAASPGAGRFFDLEQIRDEVNARYFERRVAARIQWSRGEAARRRGSILFGSYYRAPSDEVGLIKIHPALDQDWVPRGFVEFVVHHEMLHAVVPTRCIEGRRAFHPPEFRRRERAYPGFHQWRRWEKENLGRFLGKVAVAEQR